MLNWKHYFGICLRRLHRVFHFWIQTEDDQWLEGKMQGAWNSSFW